MRNILRMTEASTPTPLPGSPVTQIAARKGRRRRSRACLRCRQVFRGDGPGERICLPCKESDDWANAVAATKGFIEW